MSIGSPRLAFSSTTNNNRASNYRCITSAPVPLHHDHEHRAAHTNMATSNDKRSFNINPLSGFSRNRKDKERERDKQDRIQRISSPVAVLHTNAVASPAPPVEQYQHQQQQQYRGSPATLGSTSSATWSNGPQARTDARMQYGSTSRKSTEDSAVVLGEADPSQTVRAIASSWRALGQGRDQADLVWTHVKSISAHYDKLAEVLVFKVVSRVRLLESRAVVAY